MRSIKGQRPRTADLNFLGHVSHIRWRTYVAHQLSDHRSFHRSFHRCPPSADARRLGRTELAVTGVVEAGAAGGAEWSDLQMTRRSSKPAADGDRRCRRSRFGFTHEGQRSVARRGFRQQARLTASVQPIEDQVEPELELVAEVVAGLEVVARSPTRRGGGTRRRRTAPSSARRRRRRCPGRRTGSAASWTARTRRRSCRSARRRGRSARTEKPAARRVPMTASWWRSVAGPGLVRDSSSAIAQGWRRSTRRAEFARRRISARQSPPAVGSSISLKTRSTMPSRISSLLAT